MTIASFNELSNTWATLLWKASWQGGLALLLILALSRAWRRIPAAAQCWLWRLAFLKLLIAGIWFAPWELRWLPPRELVSSASPVIVDAEAPSPALKSSADNNATPFDATTISPRLPVNASASYQPAIVRFSLSSWLLAFWIAGVTYSLARLVRHWMLVRNLVSRLADVTDAHILQNLDSSCRKMGLRSTPALRISNDSGSPCLIGFWRPVILLPSVLLESCSTEVVNAAVVHELAHVKRRDLLWNWLPALAEVLFFFHPLVWLAKREWRLAQEVAADQLAVGVAQIDVAQYAGSLLTLVSRCRTTNLNSHLAVSVSETYSQLRRRMIAMDSFQNLTLRRRLTAGLVVIVAVCGLAPWKLANREAQARFVSSADPQTSAGEPQSPEPPKKSREAVLAEIEKLGGELVFDEKSPGRPVISISLFKTRVGDADLRHVKTLTGLRALTLDGSNVTDAGLAHLADMTSLQSLHLNSTRVSDEGLVHLTRLTRLEELGLIQTRVADAGLVHVKGLDRLVMLLLGENNITDDGLVQLKGLTRLMTLALDGTKITDAGLRQLQGLTSLQDLRLNETIISDAGLEHLKPLTRLQTLVLNSTGVSGEGLRHLKDLPALQSLWLSDTNISNAGREHIKGLTQLRTLVIDGSGISDAEKKMLQAALPECKIVWGDRPKSADLVKEFSSAESFWQQKDVARELINRRNPNVIPEMIRLLDIADRHRRCNAGFVIAGLGDPRGLTVIIGELKDKNPRPTDRLKSDGTPDQEGQIREDRYYAATLLGQLAKKEAVPALMEATADKSINYAAAISLGEIGDQRAIPALLKMAADFPENKLWAGYGLAALGEQEGFDLLTNAALSDSRWTERRHAVEALGKVGDARAVPSVVKALSDNHVNVRVSAATALGRIGDPVALSALTRALDDAEATQVNAPTTVAAEAQKAINSINKRKK